MAEALHRFDPPWLLVGRIYRRICFLRFEGLSAEASKMEFTELKEAVDAAKASGPTVDEADTILKTLLEEEGERVSEAIAFAEVLIPMLGDRIPASRSREPFPPVARPVRFAGPDPASRGIADFIDDMLAQDRRATS